MTTNRLPFKLSPAEITIWLNSLSQLNSAKAAIELNNAAKLLRVYETDAPQVLNALEQLTPSVLSTCKSIELTFLSEDSAKQYPVKIIKLCIQLLRNMSLAFCRITKLKCFSINELAPALYSAIQLIGHTQRLSAIFHELPSSSLWKEVGLIYKLAQTIEVTKITHKIQTFNNQASIESILKRNILFHIFSPYKYSEKHIKQLFSTAESLAKQLLLNDKSISAVNTFSWNPTGKNSPKSINNIYKNQPGHILINTGQILTLMQSNDYIYNLDPDVLSSILKDLSAYQSLINTPIPSAPSISYLFIGFDNVTEQLTKVGTLQKIQQLSAQPITKSRIDESELHLTDFVPTLEPGAATIPAFREIGDLSKARAVKILQVNSKKHIIAETAFVECEIGDVTLFCSSNLTNKLGVIRQVKMTNASKTLHLLIEEISGIASSKIFSTPDKSTEEQIICIQDAEFEYLIFPTRSKHFTRSKLKSVSGDKFTLNKLIDYTPFFNVYQTR